jgi:hypothetical protein
MKGGALRPSFETLAGPSFEGSLLYLGRTGMAERTGEGARAPKGAAATGPGSGQPHPRMTTHD